eukprot:jgi/Bigna1/141257/aug1.61_g15965
MRREGAEQSKGGGSKNTGQRSAKSSSSSSGTMSNAQIQTNKVIFGRRVTEQKVEADRSKKAESISKALSPPPKADTFPHEQLAEEDGEDPVPFRMQGDKKMYTKKALAKRKELSQNKDILASIDKIWNALPTKEQRLDKENYTKFFMRVCKTLNPDMEYEEKDFSKDCGGKDFLDQGGFRKSMFELVDHWTLDISVEEYVQFLTLLLSKM